MLKQLDVLLQLQETSEREKINEQYPSFELVLNFVRTDSMSVDQVHSLLEQRSDMARSVAQGYNYCADVVRTLGIDNLFEVQCSNHLSKAGSLDNG